MKVNFKFLVLFMLLAVPALIFASDVVPIDFASPTSLLTWLMPIITLGVTWLVKKIAPFVTGTTTLIVVPLIATGTAYLGTLASDSSFIVMFFAGIGSVFLNQFYRQITNKL